MGGKLEKVVEQLMNNKEIFGIGIGIEKEDRSFSWYHSSGNIEPDSMYFIASTTKLYTTATILKLQDEGCIKLDDKLIKYLPPELLSGIHIYEGRDYSKEISLRQLLSHTSGLPDYFQEKRKGERTLQSQILKGKDKEWGYLDVIEDVKAMSPKFRPGENRKALYSDTNFQLLGLVIETVTESSISDAYQQYIFSPLELTSTYLYERPDDTRPVSLFYKTKPLLIPNAMRSFGPDGGIVSTVKESMKFIRGFFGGKLFLKSNLLDLYKWNPIFFPLQSGCGLLRFQLPKIMTLYKEIPECIGHSGLSGAFDYYCPKKNVYIVGTVNQINKPSVSYKLLIKLLNCL
jgi:D-alanyl-D-alanine carboxypeptidase